MKNLLLLFVLLFLSACKSYYNDTIDWVDNIKVGTDIQSVKNNQPVFIEIDWGKPDTLDNKLLYKISKIKGSNDLLKMEHFLVFVGDKYQGRQSSK